MRTALVTGGTGGLGTAVTATLLAQGWRVVVPWIEERELERLPERDGLELVHADLFDPDAVAACVERAAADPDAPLRGVANLVGGFAAGQPVATTPIEAFDAQLRLNLRPTYLVTQAALPHLAAAGGGSIACVSSRAALRPFAGAAGYCASKAAVATFAAVVAEEGRRDGVRCNAIVPSVIETPANRAAMGADAKMVPPAQIARVVAFLLSEDSLPTSGAAIPVYGDA
ncbi:MAG TPA: SDR family NAD(P)-dependent oxidoreductase [Solirubrobacteraceae bacterium]|nr:SDR family NAD(P)-dependent oxidoreductase [Solirubrobacteraceae bacterium]